MIVGFTEIDSSKERWDDYVKDLILASSVEPGPFDISMIIFKIASYFQLFLLNFVKYLSTICLSSQDCLISFFPRKQARRI